MRLRPALLALIMVAVVLNAAAQVFLRLAARDGFAESWKVSAVIALLTQPALLAGLACYTVSLVVWLLVLRQVEVSFAYPFLALGFVLVAIAGVTLLGETLTLKRTLAIGIITAGVALLAVT